jgi:hypothetical protein
MDSKKLVKVIKALVEAEVQKQHVHFLENQFPKILEEAVKSRIKPKPQTQSTNVDPFSLAEAVLEDDRKANNETVTYTKNESLNKILNETAQTQTAVADDKTISFGTHNIPTGEQPVGTNPIQSMRQEMAQQMGYGDMRMGGASKPQAGGLGVQTGLPGLDKILNRDNSELVKRFKR